MTSWQDEASHRQVDDGEGKPFCAGPSDGDPSSYICPVCKMESFNANDIKFSYCGNCNRFNQ